MQWVSTSGCWADTRFWGFFWVGKSDLKKLKKIKKSKNQKKTKKSKNQKKTKKSIKKINKKRNPKKNHYPKYRQLILSTVLSVDTFINNAQYSSVGLSVNDPAISPYRVCFTQTYAYR